MVTLKRNENAETAGVAPAQSHRSKENIQLNSKLTLSAQSELPPLSTLTFFSWLFLVIAVVHVVKDTMLIF